MPKETLGTFWTSNIVSLFLTLVPCHVPSVWTKWFQTQASCSSSLWKRLKEIGSLRFKGKPHFSLYYSQIDGNFTSVISSFKDKCRKDGWYSVCIQPQNEWPVENPSWHLNLKKLIKKKYLSCLATISNKYWPLFISEIIMYLCINY